MKTLDFSDIISHVKPGETPENNLQAVIKYENPIYNPHQELREFFYYFLYSGHNRQRDRIFSFLDYHLSKFQGDKINFVDFIKYEIQPDRIKGLGSTNDTFLRDINIIPANEIINAWIEGINTVKKQYADKYYAWYHKILIALGKATPFTPGAKQEIIDYGIKKYGAKSGFYQAFMDFPIDKPQSFVNGLTRDRTKWKGIITEISNTDIDVITYLKNFPN